MFDMTTILLSLILLFVLLKYFPILIWLPLSILGISVAIIGAGGEAMAIIVSLVAFLSCGPFIYVLRHGGPSGLFKQYPEYSALFNREHQHPDVQIAQSNATLSVLFIAVMAVGGAMTLLASLYLFSLFI
jgi:hypothetical protein